MMAMLIVSQKGPRTEPRQRMVMSCMAIADHIQLLDMPSARSSHAALAGERSGGKSRSARAACCCVISVFMFLS